MVILDAVSQSSEPFVPPYDSEQTAGAITNTWTGVVCQVAVKATQNEIYKWVAFSAWSTHLFAAWKPPRGEYFCEMTCLCMGNASET